MILSFSSMIDGNRLAPITWDLNTYLAKCGCISDASAESFGNYRRDVMYILNSLLMRIILFFLPLALLSKHGGQLQPHAAAPRPVPTAQLRVACARAGTRAARRPAARLVSTDHCTTRKHPLLGIGLHSFWICSRCSP